jgi:hypothetical protein
MMREIVASDFAASFIFASATLAIGLLAARVDAEGGSQ